MQEEVLSEQGEEGNKEEISPQYFTLQVPQQQQSQHHPQAIAQQMAQQQQM
jgi:predicted KAP-like P-loop ATPase